MKKHTACTRLVALVLSMTVVSCQSLRPGQLRFRTQEEVASVHVAVQSVAPFEDYIAALQPQFKLSSEDALTAAIQQTQTQDTQLFQALIASLSVATPTLTTSETKTDENGAVTTKATQTAASGDAAAVTAAPAKLANALGVLAAPEGNVSIDRSLVYNAATTLMQRVAILNGYVRDAAVSRNMRPFVARMLVTLSPAARKLPYDAYTTISFFGEHDEERRPVEVIPLLATDTIESSLHQDTAQRIRDLAAALKASTSGYGVNAGVRSQREESERTLGRNLNSLFSVARLAPNALGTRLGAMNFNGQFTMLARTYDVPVLLLVAPLADSKTAKYPEVHYTASTSIRDADRGTILPSRNGQALRSQLHALALNLGILWNPINQDRLLRVVRAAESGSFEEFTKEFDKLKVAGDTTAYWNDFLAVASRMGRSSGHFSVPDPVTNFFSTDAKSTLIDDGEKATIDLTGASRLVSDQLSAQLKIDSGTATYYLNNTDAKLLNEGRRAIIEFPSPHALLGKEPDRVWASVRADSGVRNWQAGGKGNYFSLWYPEKASNLTSAASEGTAAEVPVSFTSTIGKRPNEEPIPYLLTKKIEKKAEPEPKFTMTVPSRYVRADATGNGILSVELRSAKSDEPVRVYFSVDGASISGTDPTVARTGADYVVSSDGAYTLSLKNLLPTKELVVRAYRLDGPEKKRVPVADVKVEVR